MKKIFLSIIMLMPSILLADIKYDPINGKFYTSPHIKNINKDKYNNLAIQCAVISARIQFFNPYASIEYITDNFIKFLKTIKGPEAKQLIKDWQKYPLLIDALAPLNKKN